MTQSPYRWVIVAAGGFLGCVAIGAMFCLPVFLVPLTAATGWSQTGVSSAMTIGFLTMAASGLAWEAHATAKKPGLIGFYMWSRQFPIASMYYNPTGAATIVDKELGNRSVEGIGFDVH